MASSRVSSTNLSTVVPILHLIFTVLSIAVLSYKVYFLESELSLIREEVLTGEPSKGRESVVQATPLATAASSEQPRGARNRRVSGQKESSEASSADQLQAQCVQKILNHLRVCLQ